MAMVVMEQQLQQQETHKYYCRICNKGFGCGPALGGHMRAHGVIHDDPIDIRGHADADYDPSGCSDWPGDDRFDLPPNSKCMYALHANPNHFRSCRTCGNCGKEFASWKSFLEHGKCNSDDDVDDQEDYELLASSPRSDDADDDGRIGQRSCRVWSKRKRSQRPKSAAVPVSIYPSSEEEDLANCLVMLSSASVKPVIIDEAEKSSPSASKEKDRVMTVAAEEKYKEPAQVPAVVPKGMFECKACKKVFSSHQALGGHRASHKKVKGCFAAKPDDVVNEAPPEEDAANQENINQQAAVAEITTEIAPFDNIPLAVAPLKKKSKVHECSICHRQFSSGQALGGHKRCHWITSNSPDPASIAKARQVQNTRSHRHQQHQQHDLTLRPMFNPSEPIDLNMPAAAPVDGLSALWQDIGSPLRLELLSAAISLEPWVEEHKNKATTSNNNNNNNMNSYNEGDCSMEVDDEIDSKIKLAKLSELKDVNAGGEASPWLQVGIGSSRNEGSE